MLTKVVLAFAESVLKPYTAYEAPVMGAYESRKRHACVVPVNLVSKIGLTSSSQLRQFLGLFLTFVVHQKQVHRVEIARNSDTYSLVY